MYDWEREALGVDTLGQIRGAIKTRMRVDLLNPSAQAWWIATLYGPFIWKTWRVGLLHGSIAAFVDSPPKDGHRLRAFLGVNGHRAARDTDAKLVRSLFAERQLEQAT